MRHTLITTQPPIFESVEGANSHERRIMEYKDSDMVVSIGGRTGTRSTLELLFNYHHRGLNGVDLVRTPMLLIGWFGGGTKEFIDNNRKQLSSIMTAIPSSTPTIRLRGGILARHPRFWLVSLSSSCSD